MRTRKLNCTARKHDESEGIKTRMQAWAAKRRYAREHGLPVPKVARKYKSLAPAPVRRAIPADPYTPPKFNNGKLENYVQFWLDRPVLAFSWIEERFLRVYGELPNGDQCNRLRAQREIRAMRSADDLM